MAISPGASSRPPSTCFLLVEPDAPGGQAQAERLGLGIRVEDPQDEAAAVLRLLEAREDDVAAELERRLERVAAEEVGAVVLARPDECGVRQRVAVEAERVLEDVAALALAVRRGDVRPGRERARRQAGRPRDRADAAQQRQSQPVLRGLVLG